jgi:hypothetical protein
VALKSLIDVMPASSRAAIARARRVLPLNTLDPRPNSQSLASSTASSSVANGTTTMTGPNTSSCQISISRVTPVTTVGG